MTPVVPGSPQRGVQGVKMVFGGPGKPEQTLYYFSTDISDGGLKASGFLKFAETFGPGDAMFKAASYLPHSGGFAQIRDFVLSKANNIVQDDSGIPVHYFKRDQWTFHPFGRYLGPIAIFPGRHQVQLDEIYRKGPVKPLDFGMGYRWRPNESNMLWAAKKDAAAPIAAPAALRPSISESAPQAAPASQPQQEAKPVEAAPVPAPAAQPQQEAKPVEVAPVPATGHLAAAGGEASRRARAAPMPPPLLNRGRRQVPPSNRLPRRTISSASKSTEACAGHGRAACDWHKCRIAGEPGMTHLIRQMGYVVIAAPDPVGSARDLAEITGVRISHSGADAAYVSSNARFCEVAYLRGEAHGIRAVGLEAMDEAVGRRSRQARAAPRG